MPEGDCPPASETAVTIVPHNCREETYRAGLVDTEGETSVYWIYQEQKREAER
jgi:hypothetical protein